MAAKRLDGGLAAVAAAGAFVALAAFLLFAVARSFRASIAEMAGRGMRVTVVEADGSVFFDSDGAADNHAGREEIREAFATGVGESLRHSDTLDCDLLYRARRVGGRVVRLAVPYGGVLASERLAWGALAAALATGAGAVLLAFVAARRISRRLDEQSRRLATAAENEAFRREFTSDVAHELKSPLTAILGAVEMLGDGSALSEEEKRDLFAIVRGESTRLGSLVGDILSLAAIEREEGRGAENFAEVALDEVVELVVSRGRLKAKAAGIQVELVRNDPSRVPGDAARLEEVVENLLDNAIRHSGTKVVEVSSAAAGGTATVSVRDFGVGIAEEHLPHVFERFYRVSKSRSRSLGGTGLGLAIVKHLVQLHGGTVSVASDPGVETVFSFALPLAPGD